MLTCPSCGDLWPPGARYCAECGCALLLTDSERRLLALRRVLRDNMAREWSDFIDSLPAAVRT